LKNYIYKRRIDIDEEQLKAVDYSLLDKVLDKVVQKISGEQKDQALHEEDLKKIRIRIARRKLIELAKKHRKTFYRQILVLRIWDGLNEATKKTLWTEYANKWNRLHSDPNTKEVYKDSFKDELKKFVIEHSDCPLMSHD